MNYHSYLSRRKFIQNSSVLAGSMLLPYSGRSMDSGNASGKLTVTKERDNFIIKTPTFELCLNISNGLRAIWWLNKLTGRKLDMGNGSELDFTIGLPYSAVTKSDLAVRKTPEPGEQQLNSVEFELYAENVHAQAMVTYGWDGIQQVLTKG